MNQFTNTTVEFWRDGQHNMMALRADLPKDETLVRKTPWGERYDGLSRVWFVMTEEELKTWALHGQCQFQDGIHAMSVSGDRCTFYDSLIYQASATNKFGAATVPYYHASIPMFFRKMLLRVAKKLWASMKEAQSTMDRDYWWRIPRVELRFDPAYCARIERLYGQGKGRCRIDYGYRGEECAQAIELELARHDDGNDSFKNRFDNVRQMAINSTRGFHQTASVAISIDGRDYVDGKPTGRVHGYYWVAMTPNGKRIMNGLIANHSKDPDASDWSIHT